MVLTSAVVILDYTNAAADPIHEVVLPSGYTCVTLPPCTEVRVRPLRVSITKDRIVGLSWSPYVAVIWNPGLRPVLLEESPDGGVAEAMAISDCGSIAGFTNINTKDRAWLLRKNKQTWIGPADGQTEPTSVNCSDEVVGWWQDMGGFYWSRQTGILNLGLNKGLARSINEAGQVVGEYNPGSGLSAFMWDLVNGATDLAPILGCTSAGGKCSVA